MNFEVAHVIGYSFPGHINELTVPQAEMIMLLGGFEIHRRKGIFLCQEHLLDPDLDFDSAIDRTYREKYAFSFPSQSFIYWLEGRKVLDVDKRLLEYLKMCKEGNDYRRKAISQANELPPADPLPLDQLKVEFCFAQVPEIIPAGYYSEVFLTIANRGALPWPGGWREKMLSVSYHWLNEDGEMKIFDGLRTPLPKRGLSPGQECDIVAEVQAPESPGNYILQLTAVQEHASWFPNSHESNVKEMIVKVTLP